MSKYVKNGQDRVHTTENKNRFEYLFLSLSELTLDNLKFLLKENLKYNTKYSILIKLNSLEEGIFKMSGRQLGFELTEYNSELELENLYTIIMLRLDMISSLYGIDQTIRAVEIMYKEVSPLPELSLKTISKINLDSKVVNIKDTKSSFNFKILPLTTDTKYYGKPVTLQEKQRVLNLLPFESKVKVNETDQIYLYSYKDNKEIISLRNKGNINFINVFDYKTGLLICELQDSLLFNSFSRKIGNVIITIKNEEIIEIKILRILDSIRYKGKKLIDRNKNIGTFDLETYKNKEGINKVYSLGFVSHQQVNPIRFYLTDFDNNYNSDLLILSCIDSMLISKYHNFIFYTHNFGNYDFIFIYNVLKKANVDKGLEYYNITLSTRDDSILKMTIQINPGSSESIGSKSIRIHFVDSLNLLNSSLDKLAQDFGVDTKKTHFPYSFVSQDTLLYRGPTPAIEFYPKLANKSPDSIAIYNNLYKSDWDLREETLTYLNNDLNSLLEIMDEFSLRVYIDHNTELTVSSTISRLALNIYLKNYLKQSKIPAITNKHMFNFIKKAYFGGMTEVYIPYGENLFLIDVNSLYPATALYDMPGLKTEYIENFKEGLNLDDLFGFFYCHVISAKNTYLGLLPITTAKGLVFPNGEFTGTWSTEELKLAAKHGYKIKVIKGFNFNKVKSPFKEYVTELYKEKSLATGSRKMIFKSLLNNLIGRFGININKPITAEVTMEERDYIAMTRVIKAQHLLQDGNFLITYHPTISKEVCEEHGLDYFKVLDKKYKLSSEETTFNDSSIAIAAMINSYARVFMNRIKLDILNKNGKIFYMDTDSLVLDKKGLDILAEAGLIGPKLGQFKIEHEIIKGYFISNKTYCLLTGKEDSLSKVIIKAKGVEKDNLSIDDFISLYNNKDVKTTRNNSKKSYTHAWVDLSKIDILLNHNSYSKRQKIYNNKGIWVDTRPLNMYLD